MDVTPRNPLATPPELAGTSPPSGDPPNHSRVAFHSILFEEAAPINREAPETPAFFVDLNLDQVIDAITAGREEYNLKPFFYIPLNRSEAIHYRHEIMQDLENEILFKAIGSFSKKMRIMREHRDQADKLYYQYQKERWFLEAVSVYCDAVNCLVHDLSLAEIKSSGFSRFRNYVTGYAGSDAFISLLTSTKKNISDLSSIKYCMLIRDNAVRVSKYEFETDYSADVEKTFEKFKQGAVNDYTFEPHDYVEMNHVEAGVLDLVAQLYPEIFLNLDDYCRQNIDYLDETIGVFDREVQFYISCLGFVSRFKQAGLKFCYPQMSKKNKDVFSFEGFDLALANKLIKDNATVVCNDFYLKDKERIIVVSGPNQGGKTTFARTFGQLHHMAAIGCLVPGRAARLHLFDHLFTHFEKEENINNLRGKLQDDLIRIYDILESATSESIIVMNEIFTSTTLQDAVFLGKKVLEKVNRLGLLCVFVTFIDELASMSDKTVSMVSTIVPENPARRTYKIVRRPADGLAYALSVAEKYRLTFGYLKERIKS